jgi:hypothetical protein
MTLIGYQSIDTSGHMILLQKTTPKSVYKENVVQGSIVDTNWLWC